MSTESNGPGRGGGNAEPNVPGQFGSDAGPNTPGQCSSHPERIVLGRFSLEHRRIEVYQLAGGSSTSVRLRRIAPEPAVDLGYINRIGSPFARLHLYRAEWPVALRRNAKEKTTAIWHHAARHEAEVDG